MQPTPKHSPQGGQETNRFARRSAVRRACLGGSQPAAGPAPLGLGKDERS